MKKVDFKLESYGRYTKWDRDSKELPKIREFTTTIQAEEDVEFGCILNIKKAKGQLISFTINHPKFLDSRGEVAAPFTGEYYVSSNNFRFFIGDRVWLPIENKRGSWEIIVKLEGKTILKKDFRLI